MACMIIPVRGAGADTIVESRSTEDFVARTKLGLQVRFEGARHELLEERDDIRARLFAALDAYLGVET